MSRGETEKGFSHLDEEGGARMVDVGHKRVTRRTARAAATVTMAPQTLERLRDKDLPKGDVLAVARVAGIMAAKRTPEIIPMCHPLTLDHVAIDFEYGKEGSSLEIYSVVSLSARTGVEMEALTAVSVAALTVYDMCKSVDKGITIGDIRLLDKSGGSSDEQPKE